METKKLKVIYHEDKDILSLIIPLCAPLVQKGMRMISWSYVIGTTVMR